MIRPLAGKLRGVRVMPDPLRVLLNPFEENGSTFGYVVVYGEDSPAVFDGAEWHSVLEDGVNWETDNQTLYADQVAKVTEAVKIDSTYEKLTQMLMAGTI